VFVRRGGEGSAAAGRRQGVWCGAQPSGIVRPSTSASCSSGAAARGQVRLGGGKGSGAAARRRGPRVNERTGVASGSEDSRENMEKFREQMKNNLQITNKHMYQK
jgi:hypothetical protein